MKKNSIVISNQYTKHRTGYFHPETPERIRVIEDRLEEDGALNTQTILHPRLATFSEVELCHQSSYIQLVKDETSQSHPDGTTTLSTGDVMICPDSYEIATLAVGGVLKGVDCIMERKSKNVFCGVRPPGHHASEKKGEGFCLFNNVAIGARYAQKKYGIRNVLIVDFDVHHGNGTQSIFESDPSVFYYSTHQSPSYPGTGLVSEKGIGKAIGTTVNFPIYPGQNARKIILDLFQHDLPERMVTFKPEMIFISAGFDSRQDDPIGFFNLTDEDFKILTRAILTIADKHCEGKVVSVLEGGYNLSGLASAVSAHVYELNQV